MTTKITRDPEGRVISTEETGHPGCAGCLAVVGYLFLICLVIGLIAGLCY